MVKIANAQAFWGDLDDAAATLLLQDPSIDFLTLDYLAEVSLSILAIQKQKDPSLGYARDFLQVIESLKPFYLKGHPVRIITNAGGLNPHACALACRKILPPSVKIGVVTGDDVLSYFSDGKWITANAYLGARGIVDALQEGAHVVITGRTADPSLTVAAAQFHYGWKNEAYDEISGATVAGHLIECGRQVTGGIVTDWLSVPGFFSMGYPIVEMEEDGSFVLTKPKNSGGRVSIGDVKEQLLYELGDPDCYLSPDATVSFLRLQLDEVGENRVSVKGSRGSAPPQTYKVSATYDAGYKGEAMLAFFGNDLKEKVKRCAEMIHHRLKMKGLEPERFFYEAIGCGDLVPGMPTIETFECMGHFAVADKRLEVVERFAKEIAPLVTSGPQGTTGYIGGRIKPRRLFGYEPLKIKREQVKVEVNFV